MGVCPKSQGFRSPESGFRLEALPPEHCVLLRGSFVLEERPNAQPSSPPSTGPPLPLHNNLSAAPSSEDLTVSTIDPERLVCRRGGREVSRAVAREYSPSTTLPVVLTQQLRTHPNARLTHLCPKHTYSSSVYCMHTLGVSQPFLPR